MKNWKLNILTVIIIVQDHVVSFSIMTIWRVLLLLFPVHENAVFKCFQIISSFHYGKPPSSLLWHISPLSLRNFHCYSSRDRDSMSWHGKSHLSLNSNTQQPSITVWTERCNPNWSLSEERLRPPSLSQSPPTLSLQYQSAFYLKSLHLNWVHRGTVTRVWFSSWTQTKLKGHRKEYHD